MVSIIMAVYNTADYLNDAVNSVISQTYPEWELLAVDDGSTDDSGRMLDDWAERDPRIHVFHTSNAGLSAARNVGLKNMSGDYIQFLDSDDWLAPTALEDAVSAIDRQGIDMVIFDVFYTGMGVSFHERSPVQPGIYEPLLILKELAITSLPPYACNKFCKRELYAGVIFPEGEKWEDVATTYLPVSRAEKIAVIDKPLYYYRQRSDAITKKAGADHSIYKWRFVQYRKRYEFLKKNYPKISESARNSVVFNGLMYYAWFHSSMEKPEKKKLHSYLCLPEFNSGLTSRKVMACRALFRYLPGLNSFCMKKLVKA